MGVKKRTKKRTHIKSAEAEKGFTGSYTVVVYRSSPCPFIQELTKDFRKVFEPFSASRLKERSKNTIKDFVSISAKLHISHLCIFKKSSNFWFKILKMPRGPTLTFKIHQFTLVADILSASKRQYISEDIFQSAPLVALHNFTGEGKHVKLMASAFQNMFPSINPVKLNNIDVHRCVLFSYNRSADLVDVRHYRIQVSPLGLTKSINKIASGNIPNLSSLEDISEYLQEPTQADKNAQPDTYETVVKRRIKGKYNFDSEKSAINLNEIGPRLKLELSKIEEGLLNGDLLYNNQV